VRGNSCAKSCDQIEQSILLSPTDHCVWSIDSEEVVVQVEDRERGRD
jgi:hypothetical protein